MKWPSIFKFGSPQKESVRHPDFYRQYANSFTPSIEPYIREQQFVIFDTESTGLDEKKSHLLSIGAVRVHQLGFKVEESLALRLPSVSVHREEEVAIHGLVGDPANVASQTEAMAAFLSFAGNAILVGHHVTFDTALINRTLKELGAGKLMNRNLDTLSLAKRIDNPLDQGALRQSDYTLDALCKRYEIELFARHTAEGDAYLTAILFLKLLNALSNRGIKLTSELFK